MRFARRLITVMAGCAAWILAAASVAHAQLITDGSGGGGGISVVETSTGTPAWEFVATAAVGALLTLAVLGLVFSRRSARRSEPRQQA